VKSQPDFFSCSSQLGVAWGFLRRHIVRSVGVLFLTFVIFGAQSCTKSGTEAQDSDKGGGKKGKKKGGKGGDFGPVPVVAVKSVSKDMPIEMTAVGNVEAYSTVSVRPQISGQLEEVFVEDGQYIKKNQKLFQIDPRPLQAQVAQVEATLSRDRAQLGQVTANLARDVANEKYAREQANRYVTLFKEGVVSRDDQDRFAASADALSQSVAADRASIESAKAQIQADDASLSNIKLQLGYTTIYSPIEGRAGNVSVKAGNIVTGNQTELLSIAQVAPIYVTFSVPEARLGEIQRYMAGNKLPVEANTQDDAKPEVGALTFIDNNVDSTTGTIKLKGTFANPKRSLWPGEYVNVVLKLSTLRNAVVVPNSAMQTGQDGTYLYVIGDDRRAQVRPVVVGMRRDPDLVIEKGLASGETVVTEGQLRLAPGSVVQLPGESPGGRGGAGKKKQT
jgi:multidrug efflux system membrane fusion protein